MGIAGSVIRRLSDQLADLPTKEREDLVAAMVAAQRARVGKAVDQALDNLPDAAQAEVAKLSQKTREDLRLQLLESLDESKREPWAAVLAMQSAEFAGSKLTFATRGLVAATLGLVIVTIVLVVVTALKP
jgi:hypothetical protein